MDLDFKKDNFRFNARTAAIIFNKDRTKILLYKVDDGRDFYLLPGGRINVFENSEDAIKREIKEELGYELDYDFCSIQESFLIHYNKKIMQYCFCYKAVYNKDIDKDIIKCRDNDSQYFYWVSIDNLSRYKIFPESVIKLVNSDETMHVIENIDNN